MKLLNYDKRTLVFQNVKKRMSEEVPVTFTYRQYQILCTLIRRRNISKESFALLLDALFALRLEDWRKLTYQQMYELIHVLTDWNYDKVNLS